MTPPLQPALRKLPKLFQVIRRPLDPPRVFPAGARVAGPDSHLEGNAPYQGTHNDAAQRALRVVALGRKNFLLRVLTRERAAAIYSLLGSAKLNGLDVELYLHHILERIADHPISKIHALLAWNVSLPVQYDVSTKVKWILNSDTPKERHRTHACPRQ